MLDLKLFRENPELIRKNQRKRGLATQVVDDVIILDNKWKALIRKNEQLKRKRNRVTADINKLKKEKKPADAKIKEMRDVAKQIKEYDAKANNVKAHRDDIRTRIGNILHDTVPVGEDDEENVELKRIGAPPKLDFKPKNHAEICEKLGILDTERAAKTVGAGFFYLKGKLAILDHAIQKLAIDFLAKRGYTVVFPPLMMNRKAYEGVTDLADFENVMYKIDGDDLYLIATSEHPMAAMYMGEVLNKKDLPIKLCGISPCFRREIGSHGKYTKGLFRVHNFMKIEQFIFCEPKDSWKYHEELQKNVEELYRMLEIPIRVVNVCTGDIGTVAAKKYDTEAWMADGKYREVGSNSNCTAYQTTRLNIRYDSGGKREYVHTLNNTALATSRTMIALIEAHQQKDGSIKIPRALWKYTGFKEIK